MAEYSASTTDDLPRTERISENLGIMTGEVDIDNYNTTLAEITSITSKFESVLAVVVDGLSTNGYVVKWDRSNKSFKCFNPTNIDTSSGTVADALGWASGGAFVSANSGHTEAATAAEAATDDTIGKVNFVAFGIM